MGGPGRCEAGGRQGGEKEVRGHEKVRQDTGGREGVERSRSG